MSRSDSDSPLSVFDRSAGLGADRSAESSDLARPGGPLTEDETALALAQNAARMGLWSWDPTTDQVWYSAEMYRLHGVQEGALGERLVDYVAFIHPDDRDRITEAAWAAAAGEMRPVEFRFVHPDAGIRHIMARPALVGDRDGGAQRLIGTAQDVTEVLKARQNVSHAFTRVSSYFEELPTPAYLWRLEGEDLVLRRFNKAAVASWGEQVATLVGSLARELCADQPDIVQDLHRCLETQVAFTRETDFVTREKGERRLNVTYVPVAPDAVVAHAEDISELVEAHEREERAAAHLAEYFQRIPTPAYLWREIDGEIVLEGANQAGAEQTGGRAEDFVGTTAREMYVDRPDILDDFRRAVAGETFTREVTYQMLTTAEQKDLVITYVHIPPDTVVAHTRDVTEQRRARDALLLSRARHETAQRIGHLGHWDWNVDSDELFWSPEVYRIFGVDPSVDLSLDAFLSCVYPEDRSRVQSEVEGALSSGGAYSCEHRVVRPDGEIRTVLEQGEATLPTDVPRMMVGTVLDITELKKAEEAIREREAEMSTVMEGNPDGICLIVDGHISTCNGSFADLIGYPRAELRGKKLHDFMIPEDVERAQERGRSILEGGPASPSEYTLVRCDGSRVSVEIYGARLEFRGEPALICTLRDIGARKEAERELADSRDALRALTQHLEHVREQERLQVARDLHDELGSVLTALKIDCGGVLSSEPSRVDPEVFEGMSKLLDQAIEVGRRVTARMRPGILDDLGLAAAAEWLGSDLEKRTGIRCSVVLPHEEPELAEPIATAMFRILQEALTNVIRHANAESVGITLGADAESVSLTVADDGGGFDPDAPVRSGFGLLGMRERVRALSGTFDVTSSPGNGTEVRVVLPIYAHPDPARSPAS